MTLLFAAFACSKLETAPVASLPTTDTAPPVVETEPITCRSCAVDGGFLAGTVDDEGDLSAVEGCIRLESMTVSGTELTDLRALVCLEQVDAMLRIEDNALLTDLDGLSALTSAGEIWIANNPALTDIGGLSSLHSVSDFTMYGNSVTSVAALHNLTEIAYDLELLEQQLRTVDGLEYLQRVGGTLALQGAALEDLSGFRSLTTIGERLRVVDTVALTDFTGLSALEEIELYDAGDGHYQRSLEVAGNVGLTSLRGLEGLRELRGDVLISSNDSLRDLTGLDNLASVEGDFDIWWNGLYSVAGLESLTSVGAFWFYGNSYLADIDALANLRDVGYVLDLSFNGSLTNVDGLIGLEHADLLFDSNGLQNLDGLINLQTGGYLWFTFNRDLSDISGLRNVREAEWIRLEHLKGYATLDGVFPELQHAAVSINECEGLTSIGTIPNLRSGGVSASGLDVQTIGSFPLFEEGSVSASSRELTSIGDFPVLRKVTYLGVDDSPFFHDLSGLAAVEEVDEVWLVDTALTDIDELSAVKTYREFALEANPRITDITALSEAAAVTGLLRIRGNERLCQDHVDEVVADMAIGELWAWDNGTIGCDP